MEVLAIIPARGGSKSIPRKNIVELAGKPLIAYTIEKALNSKSLDRVIVSTDDDEIANISRKYGAEVIMRPKQLATDEASTESVLQHAVKWLLDNEGYKPDIVVLLEATAPLRKKRIIDEVVNEMILTGADSVLTACKDYHYFWEKRGGKFIRLDAKYKPRQIRAPRYRENGSVYATKREVVEQGKRLGGNVRIVLMDELSSLVDIHSDFDLWLAEQVLKETERWGIGD